MVQYSGDIRIFVNEQFLKWIVCEFMIRLKGKTSYE